MNLEYECDLLDDFILKRLRKGLHTHILVTGLQGRGKSDFGIRMAERLSVRIKNGIEFKHTDIVDSLIKLLNRLLQIKEPGEIIMIEEVSVLFPARRAMTSDNVAIGRILDTIRKKRAILISNAPLYPSIDSHMRAMAEVLVECQSVKRREAVVKAKAWILQTSPHSGKTYRHTFQRGSRKVMFHYAKQSDPTIRELYEKEKDEFINNLLNKLKLKAEDKENKENKDNKPKEKDPSKLLWIQKEIYRLMTEEKLNFKETAKKLNISIQSIYKHLSSLTDMGLNPQIYLEKVENQGLKAHPEAM